MPLSEHEQRLFEQIERSLAEDPKFASAVRASDPRFHARRRVILAVFVVVAGLILLVYGVANSSPLLGVAAFAVMLGAVAYAIQAVRRGRHPERRSVGGPARRRTTTRRGGSIIAGLEVRWRQRPEDQR